MGMLLCCILGKTQLPRPRSLLGVVVAIPRQPVSVSRRKGLS